LPPVAWSLGRMDHQPLRRKYGNAHHPILVAKCAQSRLADDVETRTPMHWKDAASRTTRLVAIESWSCFSFWKVNQRIINYVRPLPSNNPGRRTCSTLSHIDPKADGFADDGNLKALLLPYPADQMRMWEISPRVNSPKNDDHRFGNPFMRSQHRRQPLRLNSCASRQTRLRDFHGPKRDSHQLSTRFPANSVWSDPDNLSKRLFGTIWL
jgi:hypothetical protein